MFIWLKKGTYDEAALAKVGIKVRDDDGDPVVHTYEESCLDPTLRLPAVPAEIIDHVTVREIIYTGFVRDGIYRNGNTQLMAKTEVDTPFSLTDDSSVSFQRLHGTADSIASIQEIMKLVRAHKLKPAPEDDWKGQYQEDGTDQPEPQQ